MQELRSLRPTHPLDPVELRVAGLVHVVACAGFGPALVASMWVGRPGVGGVLVFGSTALGFSGRAVNRTGRAHDRPERAQRWIDRGFVLAGVGLFLVLLLIAAVAGGRIRI